MINYRNNCIYLLKINLKIAIHTDWLTVKWWAEKVILDLVKIFPEADIFTTIFNPEIFPELKWKKVKTTYLQKIPKFFRKHTILMPFYPKAVESLDFSKYDLVIWSSSNITKWIITNPETKYICYCHTPVRALRSDHKMFANDPRYKFIPNFLLNNILHKLRITDFISAQRVDFFIANSEFISKRILKFYWRKSEIIYPNCEIKIDKKYKVNCEERENFLGYKKEKWEYFVSISRFVPAKKNDLLIEVFKKFPEKKLKLFWFWSEFERLKNQAKWFENIEIKKWSWGNAKPWEREKIMSKAIAFLHPQKEDFWITPIESQAFWVPVIAFWEGWAKETIINWKTWILFEKQNIESLEKIIENFDENSFKIEDLKENAEKFNFKIFKEKILNFVERK